MYIQQNFNEATVIKNAHSVGGDCSEGLSLVESGIKYLPFKAVWADVMYCQGPEQQLLGEMCKNGVLCIMCPHCGLKNDLRAQNKNRLSSNMFSLFIYSAN